MPAVRTYDDMTKLGAEVKAKGFTALKTNTALEVDGKLIAYRPGFVVGKGFPERNWDEFIAAARRRPSRLSAPVAGPMSASCSTPISTSVRRGSAGSPRRSVRPA